MAQIQFQINGLYNLYQEWSFSEHVLDFVIALLSLHTCRMVTDSEIKVLNRHALMKSRSEIMVFGCPA